MIRTPRDRRKVAAYAVTAVLVAAIGAFLARRVVSDWQALREGGLFSILHLDVRILGLVWLVQTTGWLVMIATWRAMLGSDGAAVPFRRHLRACAYSSLTYVLPGSVWTPLSRVALYRREGVPPVTVGGAIVTEWLLVGSAGLLIYGASVRASHAPPPPIVIVLVGAVVAAVLVLRPSTLGRAVRWAARRVGTEREPEFPPPARLARWLGAECVVLTLAGMALFGFMRAVSPTASLADALSVFALGVAISNLLAWLPATGIVREASFVLLLTPVYGSAVIALAVTIAWRLWSIAVTVSWAALATLAAALAPNVPDVPDDADDDPRDPPDGGP